MFTILPANSITSRLLSMKEGSFLSLVTRSLLGLKSESIQRSKTSFKVAFSETVMSSSLPEASEERLVLTKQIYVLIISRTGVSKSFLPASDSGAKAVSP